MPLVQGSRLGPYEIVALLGAGGMGEVYRAHDSKLGRDVALKTLPDQFAQDTDRLARFQREAQVLASLSHPNIAIIHGFEEAEGVRALVLELVEGPTLAEIIAGRKPGGPLPLDETLNIARQIADALEAAHEHGIIHRDLKPANIKVRPDGVVKVLDFGLAKALDPVVSGSDPSQSPTLTATTGRHDPRHGGLHEPRAGPRATGRRARGRLGVRLCVVRDAHRPPCVSTARTSPMCSPASSSANRISTLLPQAPHRRSSDSYVAA